MMRCPKHGPRPSAEFRMIGKEVPHGGGEGARVDIWKHRCGEFVWRLAKSQRVGRTPIHTAG